jgi:hypothetical protein
MHDYLRQVHYCPAINTKEDAKCAFTTTAIAM